MPLLFLVLALGELRGDRLPKWECMSRWLRSRDRQHFQDYFMKESMHKDLGIWHLACGVAKGRGVDHSRERKGTFLVWASVLSTGESGASLRRTCILYKSVRGLQKFFKFLVLLLVLNVFKILIGR